MRDDIKKYLEDSAMIRRITNEVLGISTAKLPADVDFDARQKGRPITQDDITNLNILLNTTGDVNDFLAQIG